MDETPRDGGRPAPQRRSSIPSFLFIMVMLFLLTSHNGEEFLARHQYKDTLQTLSWNLANYTAWMNGTDSNFTAPLRDNNVTSLVNAFLPEGNRLNPYSASYYSNITGFVRGDANFYNISPIALENTTHPWRFAAQAHIGEINMTRCSERLGGWSWSTVSKFQFSLVEKLPSAAMNTSDKHYMVHGHIELVDEDILDSQKLEFEGIHFTSNGSVYGFAEPSNRYIDIRMLPFIVPQSVQNLTSQLVEPELASRISKLRTLIDDGVLDHDLPVLDEAETACPFSVYGQIQPTSVKEADMAELEQELQIPTGIWTVKPPDLSLSLILISRECGMMYTITNAEGIRSRSFFRKITTYAGLMAVVYLTMLVLLARQITRSRTPSDISRISRWTFFVQAVIDAVGFAGHITFAILAEGRPSLSLVAPAFLACILFFYEAQFSVLIHQLQIPETTVTPPTINPPLTQQPTVTPDIPSGTTPATRQSPPTRPTQPFFTSLAQQLQADPQARLWLTIFIFLSVTVRILMSPALSLLFGTLSYSSIWMTQILRSVSKGRSSGLSYEYILGTAVCRISIALYYLTCPKNVLYITPRAWAYPFAAVIFVQAVIVVLQDVFSPSFFIPGAASQSPAFDYHPLLPLPDAESPETSLGDCSICMDSIYLEPLRSHGRPSTDASNRDSWNAGSTDAKAKTRNLVEAASDGLLNIVQRNGVTRRSYSLAPCHHLFHTACLEKWLAIKNICPQCRRPLPPL